MGASTARAVVGVAQWSLARFRWGLKDRSDACSKSGPNGYDVDKILADAGQPVRAGQRINSTGMSFCSFFFSASSHRLDGLRRILSQSRRAEFPL
jgi:hypothetical protein